MAVHISTLDELQRQQVILASDGLVSTARRLFGYKLPVCQINFDLCGRAAGQYQWRSGQHRIRYNPHVFAVVHEVAHLVAHVCYGLKVAAHGHEWRHIVSTLGGTPSACLNYSLDGVPIRRQQRYSYRCSCRTHSISATRHNRIIRGERYYCRICQMPLQQHLA